MWNFLAPPAHKQELPAEKIDSAYKSYRWQVFLGIFIGYAGFYIVRKNFSMAIPELAQFGFEKGELSIVLSMNAVAYALSKFLMGSVSDRSNARVFLPLGLVLAAVSMMFMIVPVQFFGPGTEITGHYRNGCFKFPGRLVQRYGMASLRTCHDPLVFGDRTRNHDVHLELCP